MYLPKDGPLPPRTSLADSASVSNALGLFKKICVMHKTKTCPIKSFKI